MKKPFNKSEKRGIISILIIMSLFILASFGAKSKSSEFNKKHQNFVSAMSEEYIGDVKIDENSWFTRKLVSHGVIYDENGLNPLHFIEYNNYKSDKNVLVVEEDPKIHRYLNLDNYFGVRPLFKITDGYYLFVPVGEHKLLDEIKKSGRRVRYWN